MSRKVLFVDRGGTLVETLPGERPLRRADDVVLVPGVIASLARLKDAGYEFVIVSNQAGLGRDGYSREDFDRIERFILRLFASQGIEFTATRYCPHAAEERCSCRKPAPGLIRDFLADPMLDRDHSAVVGDSDCDLELAANAGLPGFRIGAGSAWPEIVHQLVDKPRIARVERRTKETDIVVDVDLDREADPIASTGIGFFDHMLEQLGKHGGFALTISCRGDLEVDEHHTVEDVALALGQALRRALGEKRGIARYGFLLPMDEATAEVAIDLSGRAYFVFEGEFPRDQVGKLPTELVPHFFRSLAEALGAAIQIRLRGENTHHMIEACFKGVARALRQALARSGDALPTTKGAL
jgi:imidazoleglycerol-phosphate dehydratase / histidinol-phosphatase